MLDSVLEFLFKYRPVVFARGELAFASAWPLVVALAALAVAVPVLASYRRAGARTTPRDRAVLVSLRAVALVVLAICLARPVVLVSEAVPQRNVLGVLLDDSRSMRVADVNGRPRAEWATRQFGADSALLRALGERFELRVFRFSRGTERVRGADAMRFEGSRTDLTGALARVNEELGGAPVAGLVVVSDGADNAGEALVEPLASLRARRIPVYTVGVGQETLERDVAVSRLEVPRSALRGATVLAEALVTQRGYAGRRVSLVAEDGGRIVATQAVTLGRDGEAVPVRVRIPATEPGARALRFRVAPQDGETIAANNERAATMLVTDHREKILYVEGEPRFELKFLRRAVEADSQLQVVALQLELAERLLPIDADAGMEQLRAARVSVDEARQGTRDLATRFRSVPLGDELANARDLLVAAGLEVEAAIDADADAAPASALGPVIRETTTNVLRHGAGRRARLLLTRTADSWRYEIGNDTVPGAELEHDGSGLDGIRRRIEEAHGTLEVRREADEFVVVVTVPAETEEGR